MSKIKKDYIVAIATGGTGGHLFPGIAVAQALKRAGIKSHIILGEPRSEEKWLKKYGFEFSRIISTPISREISLSILNSLIKNIIAINQSLRIILKIRPSLAVGMGGYTSGPFLITCYLSRIPFVIFEQNIVPGLTNRLLSRLAIHSFIAFEGTPLKARSVHIIGNPIREDVKPIPRREALKRLNLEGTRPVIVIIGGSQGAMSINKALVYAFESGWGRDYEFIIQTGSEGFEKVFKVFSEKGMKGLCRDFFEDMSSVYSSADLYVGRAGGGVFEALCAGLPLILIPYPFASENHQMANALYLRNKGAGIIIDDRCLNASVLSETIDSIINNTERLKQMGDASFKLSRPDSANISVKIIAEELGKR
ncbi:MAG: undecaprenyldiphospho-muramoylpentapeptide beta-N-acetylglucosaminyltransferase [bacterium]